MTIIPTVIFLLILAGALTSYLVSRTRPRFSVLIAAGTATLSIAIWILAKGQLGSVVVNGEVDSELIASGWRLQVEESDWQVSLFVMVMAAAAFLACYGWLQLQANDSQQRILLNKAVPFTLTATALSLLAVWADSPFSKATAWTVFIVSWLVLLLLLNPGYEKVRANFIHSCFAALSVLFFWMFTIYLGSGSISEFLQSGLPPAAMNWGLAASGTMMGILLVHWWRPLGTHLPPIFDTFVHLLPLAVGGSLFVKLLLISNFDTGQAIILTLICLLGLLVGSILSWMKIDEAGQLAPALAFTAVNLAALIGIWTGTDGALSYLRVSMLAAAGFFITERIPEVLPSWIRGFTVIFATALAGLPLTAGLEGALVLYSTWLQEGQYILILVTALLMVSMLAAALQISGSRNQPTSEISPIGSGQFAIVAALVVLTISLFDIRSLSELGANIPALAIILLIFGSGVALSRYSKRVVQVESIVVDSIRLDLPIDKFKSILIDLSVQVSAFVRSGIAILEGEVGMLWILLILAAMWLVTII